MIDSGTGQELEHLAMKTLDVSDRAKWRSWLAKNHGTCNEVWLIFHKAHTGRAALTYDDAVEEALCFGWIDSLIKRIDDERYARKFTPRKPDSKWSAINRRRYAKLEAEDRLQPAGRTRPPTAGSSYAPRPSTIDIPNYIKKELSSKPAAWKFFKSLAPSYRRAFIGWIDSAKLEETRRRRLVEALQRLSDGEKLGMK
jgi:uncharacterized protein YdeI (YjbR/CyaY-like superfamily)